jgi:hypothetical protein
MLLRLALVLLALAVRADTPPTLVLGNSSAPLGVSFVVSGVVGAERVPTLLVPNATASPLVSLLVPVEPLVSATLTLESPPDGVDEQLAALSTLDARFLATALPRSYTTATAELLLSLAAGVLPSACVALSAACARSSDACAVWTTAAGRLRWAA